MDRPRHATDDALLEAVQRQTFRYFWDFGHPVSGLARDRGTIDGAGNDVVAIGGSAFGLMAMIVAAERGFVTRADAAARIGLILDFLERADRFHGAFPHFMDGATGRVVPFSPKDDGGDLVETAFLAQALLCIREYFTEDGEAGLRAAADRLWRAIDWNWYTKGGGDVLYWHWSPNHDWGMNFLIRGWNECLIAYVLAAASPDHAIAPEVYHRGWTNSPTFRNGRTYYDIELPLGPDLGGPLFFTHYSFLGLDPRGLRDRYADYWAQNVAHVRINRAYCVANPKGYKGYGPDCWGLTASDTVGGYSAHDPNNDRGVISPTAAVSSMPYTPAESMAALRHFYDDLGDRLWSRFGFIDGFSETADWYANTALAIDQGPIIVMIENHRSGLLWRLFMAAPEVRTGLQRLGFTTPQIA
jgi:hypothetical protein